MKSLNTTNANEFVKATVDTYEALNAATTNEEKDAIATIIDKLRDEVCCGNSIVTATIGNGGSGLNVARGAEAEDIIDYLEFCFFNGEVEPCDDISDYLEPGCKVYEFEELSGEGNPLKTQVIIYA